MVKEISDIIGIELKKLKGGKTPILTYCRELIEKGFSPETRVEVMRNGRVDVIVHEIGKAAKLTVREEPRCMFDLYRPFLNTGRA